MMFHRGVSDNLGSRKLGYKQVTNVRNSGNLSTTFTTNERYSYVYGDHLKAKTYFDHRDREVTMGYSAEQADTSEVAQLMASLNMLAIPVTTEHYALESNRKLPIEKYKIDYADFPVNGSHPLCITRNTMVIMRR